MAVGYAYMVDRAGIWRFPSLSDQESLLFSEMPPHGQGMKNEDLVRNDSQILFILRLHLESEPALSCMRSSASIHASNASTTLLFTNATSRHIANQSKQSF